MSGSMRRGPRPAGSDTRADILTAASELFGEHGYDAVSMRAVARQAQVDPALVSYYFGTKRELFVVAMRPPLDAEQVAAVIAALTPERCGPQLLEFVLRLWVNPGMSHRVAGTLAAANTQEAEAAYMREHLVEGLLLPAVRAVSPDEHELRAGLLAALLLGLISAAATLRIPVMVDVPNERLLALWGDQCTSLLVDPLPQAEGVLVENGAIPSPEGENAS